MNRYRCTFTGDYQPAAIRDASQPQEYSYSELHAKWPHIADAIEDLEVGEVRTDEDGDTWERIA